MCYVVSQVINTEYTRKIFDRNEKNKFHGPAKEEKQNLISQLKSQNSLWQFKQSREYRGRGLNFARGQGKMLCKFLQRNFSSINLLGPGL